MGSAGGGPQRFPVHCHKGRGMKVVQGILAFLGVSLVCIGAYSCLYVLLAGFMIQQLPFGHDQALRWYLSEPVEETYASYGFPLRGYSIPWNQAEGAPVFGPISAPFGYSPGYSFGFHTGVDFAVPVGTPVQSMMDGVVTFAGYSPSGYGYLVVVENQGIQHLYAHLSRIDVSVGDRVDAGEVVGLSGDTGRSTGPHLHWEVRVDGKPVDPLAWRGR